MASYSIRPESKEWNSRLSNLDKIWLSIESISNRYITALHSEANGYCFKYNDGTWKTAPFDFINSISGLGDINLDLI
jgi:hypothetical protein